MKLKYKDIKRIRQELLEKQAYKCLICLRSVPTKEWCLDHDHETGRIRGVLCRKCNTVEGKLRKAFIRYGLRKADVLYIAWIQNLVCYYSLPQYNYIHPRHKEKKVK